MGECASRQSLTPILRVSRSTIEARRDAAETGIGETPMLRSGRRALPGWDDGGVRFAVGLGDRLAADATGGNVPVTGGDVPAGV